MDTDKAYRILLQVARKENTTIDDVINEINIAIAFAIATSVADGNQSAMSRWKTIPCKDAIPNALELIAYLGERYAQNPFGELPQPCDF